MNVILRKSTVDWTTVNVMVLLIKCIEFRSSFLASSILVCDIGLVFKNDEGRGGKKT